MALRALWFFGFIPEKLISTTIDDSEFLKGSPADELWLMQFIIADVKKFKAPTKYAGWKADQILCESFNLKEFKKIELSRILYANHMEM